MLVKVNAKLNLCLNITNIMSDGYHEIDSIFQNIRLFDLIFVEKASGISIKCSDSDVPTDSSNTCYKMADIMMKEYGVDGVSMDIKKNIPPCAGLGGASADAAGVLYCIDKLYDLKLDEKKLIDICKRVGADVSFFIKGGCQRAMGIGEKLEQMENPFDFDIVVIKPFGGVSTPEGYGYFDKNNEVYTGKNEMIAALQNKDEQMFLDSMRNDLQEAALSLQPNCILAKEVLEKCGAKKAMVTGSGSSVFGLFENASDIYDKIDRSKFEHVFLTKIAETGISNI